VAIARKVGAGRMMTQNDYHRIESALIDARPFGLGDPACLRIRLDQWLRTVEELASSLYRGSAHNDINGNRIHSFKPKQFADRLGVHYFGVVERGFGDTVSLGIPLDWYDGAIG
jgi:hypothetical protein